MFIRWLVSHAINVDFEPSIIKTALAGPKMEIYDIKKSFQPRNHNINSTNLFNIFNALYM